MRLSYTREKCATTLAYAAIETDIPFRLDRLPWSRFHWLLVVALGVTWVLDGLEATLVGSVGPVLQSPTTLGLSASQVGLAGTLYLAGAIGGALVFGYLTDQLGRKRLFLVTLGLYLVSALLTAVAWDFVSFVLFRVMTGMAIGGEYSAINSAIDEFIPARIRGQVDLLINGSYWVGAAAGAAASIVLLDPTIVPLPLGWRLSFSLGGLVGGAMVVARRYVPESPRWLLIHGRHAEAEAIMSGIETQIMGGRGVLEPPPVSQRIIIYLGMRVSFGVIARTLLIRYRRRAILGLVLIASQAFFYNGISFTYPLVLHSFFGVAPERIGFYMFCFAAANFLGPLVLGRLFDSLGRRLMISVTYALSGAMLVGAEALFLQGQLTAASQTLLWSLTFFFASAAASAAYLTVSEIFPVEMRALAIALFYSIGTAVGGLGAPAFFGSLIDTHTPHALVTGYMVGAALMLGAAVVEWVLGVNSERQSLEAIAAPLRTERFGAAIAPWRGNKEES
jgi:MFS family permease